MSEKKNTSIVIGPVRASYANLTEARAHKDNPNELKFSVSGIIPKTDKKMLKLIEDAIKAAEEDGKSRLWGGKVPKGPKYWTPLRDGDDEKDEDPLYRKAMYVNASSKNRPKIVDADRNEILNKEEIYSGMWIMMSVNFFPFDKGSNGVGCALNNVMKVKDGPKLSAGTTPEEDFADVNVDKILKDIPEDDTIVEDDHDPMLD